MFVSQQIGFKNCNFSFYKQKITSNIIFWINMHNIVKYGLDDMFLNRCKMSSNA